MLRGKFITIKAYLKKQETSNQQPNLTPTATRKRRTKNPKVSRREEIIKIRVEVGDKEMKETIAKMNEIKSWFLEKINKIDTLLIRLIKEKREKIQ